MATTNKNSLSNEDPDRRWRADRRLLGWVFVFVSLFYFWTVQSTHYSSIADVYEMGFHGKSPEYYPLLTEGFMAGQLNLPIATKPELLRIDDPLDPTKSGALRLPDATYYRGKFYVYFGPAPVFLLYLPCKLLTGNYPTHSIGVLYFCVLGYGLNLLLLGALRRRFFPDAGRGWLLAAALTLGFATTVPQLLRRPDVWEVAISCGYLSLSAAIGAMYLALTRRSARWLAVASLAFGLAAASRPTLVFASLALLAPLAWLLRRPRGEAGAGLRTVRGCATRPCRSRRNASEFERTARSGSDAPRDRVHGRCPPRRVRFPQVSPRAGSRGGAATKWSRDRGPEARRFPHRPIVGRVRPRRSPGRARARPGGKAAPRQMNAPVRRGMARHSSRAAQASVDLRHG